jgi:alpha-L-rhamnosidase
MSHHHHHHLLDLALLLLSLATATTTTATSSPQIHHSIPAAPTKLSINGLRRPQDLTASPFDATHPVILTWERAHQADVFLVHINNQPPVEIQGATWYRIDPNKLQPSTTFTVRVQHATGILSPTLIFHTAPVNFNASKWVGGGSQVRTTFSIELSASTNETETKTESVTITQARAFASGVGSFELHCNGEKVGDHVMDPGQSVFDMAVLYVSFDLTECLQMSPLSVILMANIGNGKWGYLDMYANRTEVQDQSGDSTRAFLLHMTVTLSNGTVLQINTNPSTWQYRHGPIVYDHMWHGEIYDARQEANEWLGPPARAMSPKVGSLVPQNMPPIRVTSSSEPTRTDVSRNVANEFVSSIVFDVGFNSAGFVTLNLEPSATGRHERGGVNTTDTTNTDTTTYVVRMEHTEIEGPDGAPFNNFFPGMEFNHASKTCDMVDWYHRKWYECANQTDALIFNDDGNSRSYTPTFTYHGFRFVRVTVTSLQDDGTEIDITLLDPNHFPYHVSLVSHQVHTDLETRATVDLMPGRSATEEQVSTSKLLGSIFNATLASHTSNLWSIPTDCPQREKRGWMGDAGITSLSLQTFFDASSFHVNFLRRIADNQRKTCLDQPTTTIGHPCTHVNATTHQDDARTFFHGSVPDVVPFSTSPYGGDPGTTDWQATFIFVARNVLVTYGAGATGPLIAELWDSLVGLMEYYERMVDPVTGLLLTGARGDWVPPIDTAVKTGTEPVAAFFHTLCVRHMYEMARALEFKEDEAKYGARYKRNVAAYHAKFYTGGSGNGSSCCYESGSQTNNVFALYLGAPPTEEAKNETIQTLVESLRTHVPPTNKSMPWAPGPHLDVGIFGATWIFDVLSATNNTDLALEILTQTSYPSFGRFVDQGATTLWETWAGTRDTIDSSGTSRNHIMYGGGVNRFILHDVVGLPRLDLWDATRETRERTSFDVRPSRLAVSSLSRASGTLSGWGVHWETVSGGRWLELNVTVPPGMMAAVHVPMVGVVEEVGSEATRMVVLVDGVMEELVDCAKTENMMMCQDGVVSFVTRKKMRASVWVFRIE